MSQRTHSVEGGTESAAHQPLEGDESRRLRGGESSAWAEIRGYWIIRYSPLNLGMILFYSHKTLNGIPASACKVTVPLKGS